jgi:aspartyl protease family protein
MATFRVTIEIGPMDQSRFEQIEALVDTGATYTVVPRDVLERLGITPTISPPIPTRRRKSR